MTLVGRIRAARLKRPLDDYAAAHRTPDDASTRSRTQLELWNTEWRRIAREVPFFRELVADKTLPAAFASWQEFFATAPVTTRALIQTEGGRLSSDRRRGEWMRMTGGSTAEPIQLPAWHSEKERAHHDIWLARSWYGITPASRLFTLWGHSHLLGAGAKGWINARKRELRDYAVGYYRFSAYDMSRPAMRRAFDKLVAFQPDYMQGYSVALDTFFEANRDRAKEAQALRLRAVIGAAESFPHADSEATLGKFFGAPIAMEYGSVETSLLAHTRPSGGYEVLWRSYVLEVEPIPDSSRASVKVTSLYPRCFPLVRYELGDEIEFAGTDVPDFDRPAYEFRRVVGRCNDYIDLANGARVHSELFTHAVRSFAEIRGYQIVQSNGDFRLQYLADADLSERTTDEIRRKLGAIHPSLRNMTFVRMPRLEQTRAGKTRMIVRDR